MKNKRVLLLSGCEGNVGKCTAKLFHENDWYVVGFDIKAANENSYVDKYISCDITKAEEVSEAVKSVEKEMPVFAAFNAAGYEISTSFEETSAEDWAKLLDTLLGGSSNLCDAVAPYMIKRNEGKIVLLSTDYSRVKGDCILNATATGSLHGFGKSFGMEIAADNVLENVLFANAPFDLDAIANTVFYLADKDTYTSAQVVSVTGLKA